MSRGWQQTTLGKLCEESGGDIQTGPFGSQLHASDYVPEGIPSIMPQNIGDNRISTSGIARITEEDAKRLSRYLVRTGDIVYSRRGDVERRALIRSNEDGWLCGTGCLRVRFGGKKLVDPTFMSYYLGDPTVRAWIVRHAIGATMPNLNTSILSNVPVSLPSYNEQRAIADILNSFDEKIELNQRMNATLETMAQALFKSWFKDFDPIKKKVEGPQPHEKDAAISVLFPEEFGEEALPRGWRWQPLADVVQLNPSESLSKSFPAKYLEMAAVPTQGLWPDAPIVRSFTSGMKFRNGDTLLARITPCLENGKTCFVDCLEENEVGWGSTEFIVMRPKPPLVRTYVYLLARDPTFRAYAIKSMTGTSGRQRVQPDVLGQYSLAMPDNAKVFEIFANITEPMFAKIKQNALQIVTLSKIRDLLLARLISGMMRVQGVEKTMGAVA